MTTHVQKLDFTFPLARWSPMLPASIDPTLDLCIRYPLRLGRLRQCWVGSLPKHLYTWPVLGIESQTGVPRERFWRLEWTISLPHFYSDEIYYIISCYQQVQMLLLVGARSGGCLVKRCHDLNGPQEGHSQNGQTHVSILKQSQIEIPQSFEMSQSRLDMYNTLTVSVNAFLSYLQ